MKANKYALSMPLVLLLSTLYVTPAAFAGATNAGGNTSASPGDNSSTVRTPADPVDPNNPNKPMDPMDPSVAPATPAATGGQTDPRSDTTKAGDMKAKSLRDCANSTDKNCDKTKMR